MPLLRMSSRSGRVCTEISTKNDPRGAGDPVKGSVLVGSDRWMRWLSEAVGGGG